MFEGAAIPLIAKHRWWKINPDTRIMLVPYSMRHEYKLATQEDAVPFGTESVLLQRVAGIKDICALGYGKQSDTLIIAVEPA